MTDDNNISFAEYVNEIEDLAEMTLEESEESASVTEACSTTAESDTDSAEYEQELSEAVFESVDSHQWVIYTHYNLQVLHRSRNGPEEWKHLVADGDSWQEVVQAMAFEAMRNDLWDEIRRQQEE